MRTLELAREHADDLIALRRRLHREPELGMALPRTQELVLEALGGLDLEVTLGRELSSVTAVLRGRGGSRSGRDRPVVLLRGDMDALPVTEAVETDYRSEIEGAMHACGHDLHVAGLVGAARLLHAQRAQLEGDVVLMFQPGEEGPGGAEVMIREGLLEAAGRRVDAAYALHVYSATHPRGVFFGRPGTLMAGSDEMTVRVLGRGGHGSAPDKCLDPIPVACEMVGAVQTAVTRGFSIWDPVVVTVGKIAGGTKENIIPDECAFEATVRSFSLEARHKVEQRLRAVVEGIAQAHGMGVEVEYVHGYPPTVNEEGEWAFLEATVRDVFGPDRFVLQPDPEAGAEDFSFVANEVPSAYVNLSAAVGKPERWEDNHSPRAAFDDAVVPDAAALLAELALRRLRALAAMPT